MVLSLSWLYQLLRNVIRIQTFAFQAGVGLISGRSYYKQSLRLLRVSNRITCRAGYLRKPFSLPVVGNKPTWKYYRLTDVLSIKFI